MMTLIRFAFLLLLVACGTPAQGPQPLPAPSQPKVASVAGGDWIASPDQDAIRFKDNEGVRAYLLPIRSKSDPTLLDRYAFRITGSQSPNDGLVVVVRRKESGSYVLYRAQLRGQPETLLVYFKAQPGRGIEHYWKMYGYDELRDGGKVQVVDEPVDAQALLQLREEQQKEAISEIETTTWEDIKRWQDKSYQLGVADTNTQCGNVESYIDWSSVKPQWVEEASVSMRCAAATSALKDFCWLNPGRLQREATPTKLVCRFKEELEPDPGVTPLLSRNDAGDFIFMGGDVNISQPRLLRYFREQLGEDREVLRSGTTHVVIDFRFEVPQLFHGDGKTFYPLGEANQSRTGEKLSLPGGTTRGRLAFTERQWLLQCGDKEQVMEVLDGTERADLLKTATFEDKPRFQREPYFLARDSKGNYYYVDRFSERYGGGRYRVFVGRKGELKLSKLKRLVEDTEGTLFSTTRGDLRLIVSAGNKRGTWIKGKSSLPLTSVEVDRNKQLIFDELGVYFGEKLGFICD